MRILNEQQEALLNQERKLMNDLRVSLVQFGAVPEDQRTLGDSIQQLDELFLLVVVGEFNAGKSAFINALLGQRLLKEGVTPTTTQINLLRYGEVVGRTAIDDRTQILALPVDWLREISIVDTPGTNAVIREHEEITSQFVPRSDLVLFITSVDRPFTESERAFLAQIRDWGKKVVFVLNKADILDNPTDLEQVERFVAENARHLLGISPDIFPVSARLALRAKQGEPALWVESRFEPLERYIHDSLDDLSRLRLKLLNPLGVASHLIDKYKQVAASRLDLLKADFDMLDDVEGQLSLYQDDMGRDFRYRMSDIENILYEMDQRGQDFFEETFRLGRIFDLLSKERIQQEFTDKVVGDVPQRIERKVFELIDWLVDADLRQWQAITEHLAERRRQHENRIVGDPGIGSFHYDRERLIEGVGGEARRVVESYDKEREAQAIAEGAQAAVAASAALEVGAVGLGTLVTILATTVAADVTGVLIASLIAALGLFIIPARRRQAKTELRDKIAGLRSSLSHSLYTHFEQEIQRSLQNIHNAIAPYTRFVRSERNKMTEMQTGLSMLETELARLRVEIGELD